MISLSLSLSIYLYIYIHIWYSDINNEARDGQQATFGKKPASFVQATPNLPTNIIPTIIAWFNISGKSPMDMRIPTP